MTWQSDGQDGSGWGIYSRTFAEEDHAPVLAHPISDQSSPEETEDPPRPLTNALLPP